MRGSDGGIFRTAALERLSTPEQLDQAMRLTAPSAWVLLLTVLLASAVGVLWSMVATVPLKVPGQGILISQGGVLSVVSEAQGRIGRLMVRPGGVVRTGQVVAAIEQPELELERDLARAELEELQHQRTRIVEFHIREMEVRIPYLEQKKRDLTDSIRHVEDRIRWLKERERDEQELLDRKYIGRQKYIDTRVDLYTALEQVARARNEVNQVDSEVVAIKVDKEHELLGKEMAMAAAARRVEAIEARLARQSRVLSPYDGTVVEIRRNEGELVEKGVALLSLVPPRDEAPDPGGGRDLVAVLYAPPGDGKKIQPGMDVEIAPSTVKREEYGFMLGRVVRVAEIPATGEGMMRMLKNPRLVDSLSGGGAPFEVIVELERDPSTPTGFKWSSSRGPEGEITTGTLAESAVTVRRVRLISLVVPMMERLVAKP
ncbi:MAG: NHLP bacteriocin system secretion protein [Alphaproteobacteria bacterium]|nr:NHLP bacteriocin system secretion protein [Alphaproteobacteria bacterium]